MNRRQQQAQTTKKRILEQAYAIVRQEGVQALSANKIVKAAGISKGGFFHHFPQIEDLYLYLLDDLMQTLLQASKPDQVQTFSEFMAASCEFLFDFLEQSPEITTTLFYFLSLSPHNPAYQERLENILNSAFAAWAEGFAGYFAPALSEQDRQTLVRMTDMFFAGFSLHYLLLKDRQTYRQLAQTFAEMVEYWFAARQQS